MVVEHEKIMVARNKTRDMWLWIAVALLLLGGFAAHWWVKNVPALWRFCAWLLIGALACGCAALTSLGRVFTAFVASAKVELFKMVWPSRDETVKVTAVVAFLVFLTSIILWCMDSFFIWIFSLVAKW